MQHQSSAWLRRTLGRVCIVVASVTLAWAVVIYPVAFEYASREERAAVAGGSKLGFFSSSMVSITSGWFTAFLLMSFAVAFVSLRLFRDSTTWRRFEWGVLVICVTLIAVHVLYDGPAYVAGNVWSAVTHPSSFHWPLDYFSVAVEKWGAWP